MNLANFWGSDQREGVRGYCGHCRSHWPVAGLGRADPAPGSGSCSDSQFPHSLLSLSFVGSERR